MSVCLRTFSFLFVLTHFLYAASISVSVTPANPSEGETVSYNLTLTGAKSNPNVIAFPKSPGLSMNWQTQPSTSRSMSFDNRTGQKLTLPLLQRIATMGFGRAVCRACREWLL